MESFIVIKNQDQKEELLTIATKKIAELASIKDKLKYAYENRYKTIEKKHFWGLFYTTQTIEDYTEVEELAKLYNYPDWGYMNVIRLVNKDLDMYKKYLWILQNPCIDIQMLLEEYNIFMENR